MKEMHCCSIKKGKRFAVVIALLAIGFLFLVAIKASGELSNRGNIYSNGDGSAANYGKAAYMMPPDYGYVDPFVVPEDALKKGEIAIVVSDLESARKSVADIASNESGSIYATNIKYSSDKIKNGSIVVQVPMENFDSAFAGLKKIGNKVIQESTQQIPLRNYYQYPMPLAAQEEVKNSSGENISDDNLSADVTDSDASAPVSQTEIAPAYPIISQPVQDKGYIKVIFVDYGKYSYEGQRTMPGGIGGGIFGVSGYMGQNMRSNILLVIIIKSILLIVLIALLVVIFKKIFKNLRKEKVVQRKPQIRLSQRKPIVHVVRQTPKTRSRTVRIAKNK